MLLDYWSWTYRDPETGQRRTTGRRMTAIEAQAYPQPRRVPGTLHVRNNEMDFEDTAPLVFHTEDGE
jgi:hypothetical protein